MTFYASSLVSGWKDLKTNICLFSAPILFNFGGRNDVFIKSFWFLLTFSVTFPIKNVVFEVIKIIGLEFHFLFKSILVHCAYLNSGILSGSCSHFISPILKNLSDLHFRFVCLIRIYERISTERSNS